MYTNSCTHTCIHVYESAAFQDTVSLTVSRAYATDLSTRRSTFGVYSYTSINKV